MDPNYCSLNCCLPWNNNTLHCTLQQELLEIQSAVSYVSQGPEFNLSSNNATRQNAYWRVCF